MSFASFQRHLPLFSEWTQLALPTVQLGDWPTPLEPATALARDTGHSGAAFIKRDDLSSPIYGGNKVRCLEVLFAEAIENDCSHIEAMGAVGTNHGLATLLHAPRVGLDASAIVFPQPRSESAGANYRVLQKAAPRHWAIPHWFFLPFASAITQGRLLAGGTRPFMMPPGGATPRGALAYVSAALELVLQCRDHQFPIPRRVVVGAGSTCTAAGLLAGFGLAAKRGLIPASPIVHAVRVTPWPVTSKWRIASFAHRATRELATRANDPTACMSTRELLTHLHVDGSQLGRGYGYATEAGREALTRFRTLAGFSIDTTYSAKAAAAYLARLQTHPEEPIVFWSTKSTAPLPTFEDGTDG